MNAMTNDPDDSGVAWANQISKLLKQGRDDEAATGVELAADQFKTAKFQIAVLGKAKRGKSTLINALLGRRDDVLAPIDKLPASSAISRFSWADVEGAQVTFRDGHQEHVPTSSIRDYVTEEFNKENHKGVHFVDVQGPFAGLEHDFVLIDTPGAGSLHEHHDTLLHDFIPQADAVLFLVTASMPLDQDELELLREVRKADIEKIFFALNKIDERSERDIDDAIRHNRGLLSSIGIPCEKIFHISAKRAFQGEYDQSGLADLKSDIGAFLSAHKGRVMRERLSARVKAQAAPALLAIGVQLASYRKSTEQLDDDLQSLRERKRAIESERGLTEREFTRTWNLALDQFEQGLQSAKADISAEITNRVAKTPVLEVSKLARQLPTELNRVIEVRLATLAHTFEQASRGACERLNATYPALSVGEAGAIGIRTEGNSAFLLGLAGGGAAATTGIGVAAGAGAVAAGIAAANASAMAATATVAAPSIVSSLLTLAGFEILAPLATGTATVAAPAALTATPLWVVLAGPVGWTLAGIGLMAVPFSWRLSKLKLKEKLEEASAEQIRLVFGRLQSERVPALRKMSQAVLEEFRIKLDRELGRVEGAILQARDNRPAEDEILKLEQLARALSTLLQVR